MDAAPAPSPARRALRIIAIVALVLGIAVFVLSVTYTDVPQERLAASEMISLAGSRTTPIAEAFQAWGTLDGHMEGLLPPATAEVPNSKGPFEWRLAPDGTLRGHSARYGVTVEFATQDGGLSWTCHVEPPEFAPRVGTCAPTK